MDTANKSQITKKNRNKTKKIKFDDEIITKDSTTMKSNHLQHKKGITVEENTLKNKVQPLTHSDNGHRSNKKSKNKKKRSNLNSEESDITKSKSIIKENLEAVVSEEDDIPDAQVEIESELMKSNDVTVQKEESIRARKRRKHMELLQAKKLRHEVDLQQKCLNYLSLWKHSRSQWKFEKLKQIWLQQNMFDDAKIPDEFWDTLVEYFNSAKGQAKSSLLSSAVKIVDSVEEMDDESPEKTNVKYLRARNIVQNIQE